MLFSQRRRYHEMADAIERGELDEGRRVEVADIMRLMIQHIDTADFDEHQRRDAEPEESDAKTTKMRFSNKDTAALFAIEGSPAFVSAVWALCRDRVLAEMTELESKTTGEF